MQLLSEPSKMPWLGFSLPAGKTCPGVCKLSCYARRNNYVFPDVIKCLAWRYELSQGDGFAELMASEISARADRALRKGLVAPLPFRVHDSGDFYSSVYAAKWRDIARRVGDRVLFYAPTKAYCRADILRELRALNTLPNFVVRPSTPGYDEDPLMIEGLAAGTRVHSKGRSLAGAFECPAFGQGNKCADCRVCWESPATTVSYHRH